MSYPTFDPFIPRLRIDIVIGDDWEARYHIYRVDGRNGEELFAKVHPCAIRFLLKVYMNMKWRWHFQNDAVTRATLEDLGLFGQLEAARQKIQSRIALPSPTRGQRSTRASSGTSERAWIVVARTL